MPKVIDFLGYVPFEKELETLGEKIVCYRWLKGITQKELAGQLGVDPTTLARWEKGEREPRDIFRERLFNLLKSPGRYFTFLQQNKVSNVVSDRALVK